MTGSTYEQARKNAEQMLTDGATAEQVWEISSWYAATCRDTARAYKDAVRATEGQSS